VAKKIGIDVYGLSGGAVLDDYDGDGHLDLVLSAIGLDDPLRFFHNRGDGTFEDRSAQAGLPGITGGLNMVQADYDNDGRVDILVLRGAWMKTEGRFPLSLLRNEGGGRFADVTKAAGLLRFAPPRPAPGSTTTATDGSTCSSGTSPGPPPDGAADPTRASSSTTTATAPSARWRANPASRSSASSRAW
jgi:hypothetical protein